MPRSGDPPAGAGLPALVVAALGLACLEAAAAPAYLGVLPAGDPRQGGALAQERCAACHGARGNSIAATFPNLAGQNANYLLKQLEDFASGVRPSPVMGAIVQSLPAASRARDFADLAAYFAAQRPDRHANANAQQTPPARSAVVDGYSIYHSGIPAQQVPACAACHLGPGTGLAPMAIPALAGQHADYVVAQLKLFAAGGRAGGAAHVMALIAARLKPQQIAAVAQYLQALQPERAVGIGPKTFARYAQAAAADVVPGIPAAAVSGGSAPPAAPAAAGSSGAGARRNGG